MTNYEHIKNMSIDEMAREINHIGNAPCYPCNDRRCTGDSGNFIKCCKGIKEWLNSEVGE